MEISSYSYMLILAILNISAVASITYIIMKTGNDSCLNSDVKYFKIYFFTALVSFTLKAIQDALGYPMSLVVMASHYTAVSIILLLALEQNYRTKLVFYSSTFIIISFLISSTYLNYTVYEFLMITTIISIILYSLILYTSIKKSRELNNIGYIIMSFAFLIVVVSSIMGLIFLLNNDTTMTFTLLNAGASIGFILVVIGYLSVNLMLEYNKLNKLALTDTLTGMNNRRGLYYLLDSIIPSSNRSNKCFSVISIDIDFFKKINDTYGHDVGDIVLKKFSELIKKTHRNSDISSRFGGEEFIIVLPDTDKETAIMIAEKMRIKTEKLAITIDGATVNITASFGVDTSCSEINIDELISNSDKSLYIAKFAGRNKVIHIDDNCMAQDTIIDNDSNEENDNKNELSGNILIAEDNKTNQMLIGVLIANMGLTYRMANDGLEAVKLFSKEKFDLVLMDQNMPNMNGTEAMLSIRESHGDETPIIVLTANTDSGDKEKLLKAGMDGYIAKPIDNDELYSLLSSYLKPVLTS